MLRDKEYKAHFEVWATWDCGRREAELLIKRCGMWEPLESEGVVYKIQLRQDMWYMRTCRDKRCADMRKGIAGQTHRHCLWKFYDSKILNQLFLVTNLA